MFDNGIITDGGRKRRWSSSEKLGIVEETLDETASISIVARRNGAAPDLLYRWRRLMLEGVPWLYLEAMMSQAIRFQGSMVLTRTNAIL